MTPAYNCLTFDTTLNAELLDSLLDVNTTLTLGTALIHSALLLTLAFILNVGITPVRKFAGLSPNARLIDCRSRIHSPKLITPIGGALIVFIHSESFWDSLIYLLDPTDRRSVFWVFTKRFTHHPRSIAFGVF